jgi:hypothetical protein
MESNPSFTKTGSESFFFSWYTNSIGKSDLVAISSIISAYWHRKPTLWLNGGLRLQIHNNFTGEYYF